MLIQAFPPIAPAGVDQASSRILHLIDVENLLGSPNFTVGDAAWGRALYAAAAPVGVVNQIVISTCHRAAPAAWFAWPGAVRRLVRSGRNGADIALLDVLASELVERRFNRVVIGSGDGIFAFSAARLQAEGCPVTVVARRESLSGQLRLAVRDICFLEAPPVVVSRQRLVA